MYQFCNNMGELGVIYSKPVDTLYTGVYSVYNVNLVRRVCKMPVNKRVIALENRLTELLAIKSRKEGRTISLREMGREIDVSANALSRIARNATRRFDEDILLKIFEYLNVTHAEFFITVIETEDDKEGQKKAATPPAA